MAINGVLTRGLVDPLRAVGTSRAFPVSVTVDASTSAVDSTNNRKRREHIQLDPDLWRQMCASNSPLALRNQIVLTIAGYPVPLSVIVLEQQTSILTARIGVEALARFPGVSLPVAGVLTAYAPAEPANDAAAQAAGQYYEFIDDDEENDDTIVIAPHGGNIELETDEWAAEFKIALDAANRPTSVWGGRGYGLGGHAPYDRHHISTIDIDERLNPLLATVYSRGWARCISLHGQSGEGHLDLGCDSTENAFVDSIVSALNAHPALAGIVAVRTDNTDIAGSDNHNLMNRLAPHAVQVESTLDVRQDEDMRAAVCEVFATAYGAL